MSRSATLPWGGICVVTGFIALALFVINDYSLLWAAFFATTWYTLGRAQQREAMLAPPTPPKELRKLFKDNSA